jgi:hypothetical protein
VLVISEKFLTESLGMLFVALVLEMHRCFLYGCDINATLMAMEEDQSQYGFLGFTAHLCEDTIRKQVQILVQMR